MMKASGLLLLAMLPGGCALVPRRATGPELPSAAQEWVDPSPHSVGYVRSGALRLHYLDWGGAGETILLIPGLHATAHAFDDLAPGLTSSYRVIALTPRAHGESSTPDSAYTVGDAAADVLVLMDSLRIQRAHLVGHSISGSTITRVAATHPGRVGKLVFLDATYDYGGPDERAMEAAGVPRPAMGTGNSPAASYRDWSRRYFYGTWSMALEADMWAGTPPSGEEGALRGPARAALFADVTAHPKEYSRVAAPALAIWARKTMDSHFFWLDRAEPEAAARAREYLRLRDVWEGNGAERFRREMAHGKVVAFPAHHWVFVSHQQRVLRELRAFLR
jgi:pimeloyl-ACP methyl ester carboxylesterase